MIGTNDVPQLLNRQLRAAPSHLPQVAFIGGGVVLEGGKQLLIKRIPKAQLDRRTTIRTRAEKRQNRLTVSTLRCRCKAKQNTRRDRIDKSPE